MPLPAAVSVTFWFVLRKALRQPYASEPVEPPRLTHVPLLPGIAPTGSVTAPAVYSRAESRQSSHTLPWKS